MNDSDQAVWCRRHRQWRMFLAGLPLLFSLAGCGGGGGGSGTSPGASAAEPSSSATSGLASLVPQAPAIGKTLEVDAAVLVPQTAGSSWRFWGRQFSSSGSELARYESSYQLTTSGGEWKLSGSNPGNDGPDSIRYVLASGQLQQIQTVQFTPTQLPDEVRITLLRSPVREGDQVVAYNKRVEGVADLDGDGRPESLDVAIYTRVIGTEKIETALGEQLEAVRVETHVVERVIYSKTGQAGPVVDIVGVDWLARQLGWVARDQPSVSKDGQIRVGKERLVGADLGAQGAFGNSGGPVTLTNPTTSPEQAGLALAMQQPSAVSDGDRVLLIGTPPVVDYSYRPLLTLLNSRGEVQWTRLGPAGARFAAPLGSGWVLWGNLDNGQVTVFRLDAQGQLLGSGAQLLDLGTPQTPLPSQQRVLAIAADARALWVATARGDWLARADGTLGPRDGVVVRGYDLNGAPTTDPVLLERSDDVYFRGSFGLAVRQGNAQVAWLSTKGGLPHLMLARVSPSGVVTSTEAKAGALSAASPLSITANAQDSLLNWGSENRFAWIDDAFGLSVLDATRSDGTLTDLPIGLSGLAGSTDVGRGDQLFRWNLGESISSGASQGNMGWTLQWQLYRRGQASPQRKAFVAAGPGLLVVPLSSRALVLSRPVGAPQTWVVEQIAYR